MQIHRAYLLALALMTVATAAYFAVWASVNVAYRGPDEPLHVNSVLRLAYSDRWPPAGEGRVYDGVREAMGDAAFGSDLPGSRNDRSDVEFEYLTAPEDRQRITISSANISGHRLSASLDQMTQHPPLYYFVVAQTVKMLGAEEGRWDQQLLIMRLVSLILTLPAVPFAAETVRAVTGSRSIALAAASVPLAIPQLGHIAGTVNNDTLAIGVGAVLTYLIARIAVGTGTKWVVGLSGVMLGVALLIKGTMVAFIPALALALLLDPANRWNWRFGRLLSSMLLAFVIGGWWWARNILLFGAVQPSARSLDSIADGSETWREFIDVAWGRLPQTFWGEFAWLDIPVRPEFVAVMTAVGLSLCIFGLLFSGNKWRVASAVALIPLLTIAPVILRGYLNYLRLGMKPGLQGRYFFPAVVALTLLAALGIWWVLGRSERRASWVALIVCAVSTFIAAYGISLGFAGYYVADGEDFGGAVARWLAWSPLSEVGGYLLVGSTLATLVAALVSVHVFGVVVRRQGDAVEEEMNQLGSSAEVVNP